MLHAIIMAGGSGTRFWPRSRRDRPKQLLRLAGESTMLQQTVARVEHLVPPERVFIITGADQAAATRAQLPDLPEGNVVAEPAPRDTAPCVALAAGIVASRDPSGTMIVMPADHVIEPVDAFRMSVRAAVASVDDDPSALVTFGITPNRPETGYGYIERGDELERREGIPVYRVLQFREKPDRADGRAVPGGRDVPVELGNLRLARPHHPRGDPRVPPPARRGLRAHPPVTRKAGRGGGPGPPFPAAREGADRQGRDGARDERPRAEVPYDWNDVGDWRALATLLERDTAGNAIQGHVVARDTRGSIIISDDGGIVATLGVDDLVIVHSGKATLVARKDRLDDLKALVEGLAKAGYGAHL